MTTTFGPGALEMLGDAIADLDQSIPGWLETIGADPVAALLLLDDIRARRTALARVEAGVESCAARLMTGRKETLPDGRVAERNGGSAYKQWDDTRVAGRVAAVAVVDARTGEIGDEATAYRVRDAILRAGRVTWRTRTLKAMGVEFGDCCVREPGRHSISISAPKAVDV